MKPKDLKRPHSWEERRPQFHEGVFFVPDYFHEHQSFEFPRFEDAQLFGNGNPVHIEYCSGNGAWIIERASLNRNQNWIAVEKDFERVRKIWSKARNLDLKNLQIVCGEALTFSKHYLQDLSLDAIYINFPDPWPKDRHAKHRLVQLPFAREMERILKQEGRVTLVTDDHPYCQQMCQVLSNTPSFDFAFEHPYYITEWPGYGGSYFNDLWREKGRTIHYIQAQKNS